MNKFLRKPLIFLIFIATLWTCIDPYSPELDKFESLLVVDALLTNENSAYSVKIARTNQVQNDEPVKVTGAFVTIRDQNGTISTLQETSAGLYKTDSLLLQGQVGQSYILNIVTQDGDEYESEPCLMYPVQQVDNIYYSKDQEIVNNGNEPEEGIRIFIDSETSGDNSYLRWVYNEWWKVIVPDPKKYNYINDTTILEVDQIKQTCWRNKTSDEISIQFAETGQSDLIEKKPILFINSDESDRLLIQYYIEVKQLSISKKEYEFWDQMQQISESGGDIFEKQPFPIVSNIHNVSDPDEPVLGYFQVSAVSSINTYITNNDIADLDIPLFNYDCDRFELGPDDYPPPLVPTGGMTFDRIYRLYVGETFTFVEPRYNSEGKLSKLVFSKHACSDCTINGNLSKPDFWIDLE